jgi:hypothetical protein
MGMPGLDDPRIAGGNVDLPEALEKLIVVTQDLHQVPALVGVNTEQFD